MNATTGVTVLSSFFYYTTQWESGKVEKWESGKKEIKKKRNKEKKKKRKKEKKKTNQHLLTHSFVFCYLFSTGTLSTISSLATFSQSRLMFWRESSQDVSIFSIWLSRNVTDLAFVLLQTLAFVGIVYDMTKPLMPIKIYYYIYVAVGFSNR